MEIRPKAKMEAEKYITGNSFPPFESRTFEGKPFTKLVDGKFYILNREGELAEEVTPNHWVIFNHDGFIFSVTEEELQDRYILGGFR